MALTIDLIRQWVREWVPIPDVDAALPGLADLSRFLGLEIPFIYRRICLYGTGRFKLSSDKLPYLLVT